MVGITVTMAITICYGHHTAITRQSHRSPTAARRVLIPQQSSGTPTSLTRVRVGVRVRARVRVRVRVRIRIRVRVRVSVRLSYSTTAAGTC